MQSSAISKVWHSDVKPVLRNLIGGLILSVSMIGLEMLVPFGLLGVLAYGAIEFVFFSKRVNLKKRRKTLVPKMQELGFIYGGEEGSFEDLGIAVDPLGVGGRVLDNFRKKIDGGEVLIFDFAASQFVSNGSRSGGKAEYRFTVVAFKRKNWSLPKFIATRQTLTANLQKITGVKDVDFKEDPEFSKTILLQAKDSEHLREVFDENVRGVLTHRADWAVQGEDDWLLAFKTTGFTKTDEMQAYWSDALGFYYAFAGMAEDDAG